MISWNAPPPMLISNTPPSKLLSRSKFWRKLNWAELLWTGMLDDSRRLSLIASGSLTNAALGSESADGKGSPSFDVTHNTPSGSITLAAVHPEGSAGGVTPSKSSLNTVVGSGHRGSETHVSSASTLERVATPTPPNPPAANTLAPIDVPDANERSWFRLGESDQLSVPGS
jgi:hypothetical protein